MQEIGQGIRLEKEQHYENVRVLPLLNGMDSDPVYLSLKEALDRKQIEITEVSESGSVPTLKATNKANVPILIIDGEELIGAKQNRIVNTTILLKPNSETLIPVSCTEHGRWSYSSRHFANANTLMSAKARYSKSYRVRNSLRTTGTHEAEQREVWNDVSSLHTKMKTTSHTRAMHDVYAQKKVDIDAFLAHFPIVKGQKGMMIFVNDKLAGMDFLSRSDAYVGVHEKLLKSHIVEAISAQESAKTDAQISDSAKHFLENLQQLPKEEFESVGLGKEYHFEGANASAATLVYEDQMVHITAFPNEMIDNRGRSSRRMSGLRTRVEEHRRRRSEANQSNEQEEEKKA